MKCAALTGISPSIIAELKGGKARTLELYSAHNIITLTRATPGECIFMTWVNEEDLAPGDQGIMVELLVLSISMKKVEIVSPLFIEEHERTSARIKIQFRGTTIARGVDERNWGDPTTVEVIRSACYRAG